ncbi:MAG TPA: endonuclease III domain-containing protein [Gammaproteobacteria bacterium]|nr:endonuclease III domain-containing protein [Gammaproteobacteria bacterium]
MNARRLRTVYERLHHHHGPQHWWPGDTPFEIMVGAVLTQNTAWRNVERAIANLIAVRSLDARRIVRLPLKRLAELLRPSGYFNVKARRLRHFCEWLLARGGVSVLKMMDTPTLRHDLLAVHGVGPETADDILLYALHRPVFVIDAYTRRLFSRLGLIKGDESYETLRTGFETALGPDVPLYNEYHALIVRHAKEICRPRPRCEICCLRRMCPSRQRTGRAAKN